MATKPGEFGIERRGSCCKRTEQRPVHRRQIRRPMPVICGFHMRTASNRHGTQFMEINGFGIDATHLPGCFNEQFHAGLLTEAGGECSDAVDRPAIRRVRTASRLQQVIAIIRHSSSRAHRNFW